MGTDSYWPDGTLADLLDIHVQNYDQDFREYWHLDSAECPTELSAEDWALIRILDRVGSRVVDSARALRVHPELAKILKAYRPFESPVKAASELVQYDVAQSRAEIELASSAVSKLFEGKKRLATILLLLSRFELSERAAAYVDRMVQCYIWGLDTECIVMARSVLEAALEETIGEIEMGKLGFRRGKYGFDFWQYRDAALKSGRLDPVAVQDLEEIRRAGNDAVHATPGLHDDPVITIARTVVCLRALLPQTAA